MFVGHYGPSLAAKAAKNSIPLWVLFIAVQLLDVAWSRTSEKTVQHALLTTLSHFEHHTHPVMPHAPSVIPPCDVAPHTVPEGRSVNPLPG